jgi:hypothetical protein
MVNVAVVPAAGGEVREGSVAESVGERPPVMDPGEMAKVFALRAGTVIAVTTALALRVGSATLVATAWNVPADAGAA